MKQFWKILKVIEYINICKKNTTFHNSLAVMIDSCFYPDLINACPRVLRLCQKEFTIIHKYLFINLHRFITQCTPIRSVPHWAKSAQQFAEQISVITRISNPTVKCFQECKMAIQDWPDLPCNKMLYMLCNPLSYCFKTIEMSKWPCHG